MHEQEETLTCTSSDCGRTFPVVGGRPVLIDEDRSVFAFADYWAAAPQPSGVGGGFLSRLKDVARRLPSPSINLSAARCFGTMKKLLLQKATPPDGVTQAPEAPGHPVLCARHRLPLRVARGRRPERLVPERPVATPL
jgi:hypothetical protein